MKLTMQFGDDERHEQRIAFHAVDLLLVITDALEALGRKVNSEDASQKESECYSKVSSMIYDIAEERGVLEIIENA